MTRKLYKTLDCPYCQMVERALGALGLDYQVQWVPKDKSKREELIELTQQREVPVLVDGEQVVAGSQEIFTYLKSRYGHKNLSANYGISKEVEGSLEEVKAATLAALKEVGFGVLTEIDVKATLKKKLGVDVPAQLILGACNPEIAHRAMDMEPQLGLLLPCNVVIREAGEGKFLVSAIHPVKMLSLVGRPDMLPLAEKVKELLTQALENLKVPFKKEV